jgi:predicted DNA-binding protein (UPF0251 family)
MPSRNPEGEHFKPVRRAPRLFQTWTVVSPVPVRVQTSKKIELCAAELEACRVS